jgi:hypothetical protein
MILAAIIAGLAVWLALRLVPLPIIGAIVIYCIIRSQL